MRGFDDVTLEWRGEEFTVPASDQLMLITKIEDALTYGLPASSAVVVLSREGGPTESRLARAYAAALRHAGAKVSDDEVYLSMMKSMAEPGAEFAISVQGYIWGLLSIITPPGAEKIEAAMDGADLAKKSMTTDPE